MFITLEGPEGSGKTTQAKRLITWLAAAGFQAIYVREPGGTAISDRIRTILLDSESAKMDIRTELLLFCASRAQLVSERIKPYLASGGVVVCDRYADSTIAYQGYARGLDLAVLNTLIGFATYSLMPDITLLLDVDVSEGLARKTACDEWNRLDAEAIQFHQSVREGYLTLAASEPERWVTLDASQSADLLTIDIQHIVGCAIAKRNKK